MKVFNKKNLIAVVTAVMMSGSVSWANASITIINNPTPTFTVGEYTINYSTSNSQLANRLAYSYPANNDFNQSPAEVGAVLYSASVFNLSGPLYVSSYTDGTVETGATQTGNGSKTGSFTSNFDYKYLAVHFDNKELFFDFSSTGGIAAGQTFNIGTLPNDLPNGLSNWRAYNSNPGFGTTPIIGSSESPTVVPVPAAVWLFGSALAGFGAFTRRKS